MFVVSTGNAVRVAQWIARLPPKQKVVGSNPTSDVQYLSSGTSTASLAERLRRYVQVVVLFEGVGSSPTECNISFFLSFDIFCSRCLGGPSRHSPKKQSKDNCVHWTASETEVKRLMAVPGFEPGSSGSQPLMLTTTLYHRRWFLLLEPEVWSAIFKCCPSLSFTYPPCGRSSTCTKLTQLL